MVRRPHRRRRRPDARYISDSPRAIRDEGRRGLQATLSCLSASNPKANLVLNMKSKLARLFVGILCLLIATTAYSQDTTEVHARLVLADAKTAYRVGEPIRLLLQFTG